MTSERYEGPHGYWVRRVQRELRDAQRELDKGNDKMAFLMADEAFEEIPAAIREKVRSIVERLSDVSASWPADHTADRDVDIETPSTRQALARSRSSARPTTVGPSRANRGRPTEAFMGSDAALTRKILRELQAVGQIGRIAAELFRAQKASARAKRYRGRPADGDRSYRAIAYERKGESHSALCEALARDSAGLSWGWGRDAKMMETPHVLYVDCPGGQVSFHSAERYVGPEYPGKWDGAAGTSERRVLELCDGLLEVGGRV